MYQATIVKFDRKTREVHDLELPPEQNIDAAQVNMVSPQASHVDGKVWTQNNGFAGVHRLDLATGKIETWEPFKSAPKGEPHNIYDVIPDSQNNVFFTDFRQRHIGRIDAKTGEVKLYKIPDAGLRAAPRHDGRAGPALVRRVSRRPHRHVRHQHRAVQGVAAADALGRALRRRDRQEREAWTGSMITDQVTRLDPQDRR